MAHCRHGGQHCWIAPDGESRRASAPISRPCPRETPGARDDRHVTAAIATVLTAPAVFGPVTGFSADVTAGYVSHARHGAQATGGQLYIYHLAL